MQVKLSLKPAIYDQSNAVLCGLASTRHMSASMDIYLKKVWAEEATR